MEIKNVNNTEAYKDLLEIMQLYKVSYSENSPYILLDGILDTSHNLFIHAAIGLAANEVLGWNVAFISNGNSKTVSDLAKAIGAEEINLNRALYGNRFKKIKYYCDYIKHRTFPETNNILSKQIHNTPVGDLIYDSIIRSHKGIYTASHFTEKILKKHLWNAYSNYHAADQLFKKVNVACISLSHKYYTKFGVIARYATAKNAKFISKNRSHLKVINSFDEHYLNDYYIDKNLSGIIDNIPSALAEDYIEKRFKGELDQHDVKFSYTSKNDYELNSLREKLALDPQKPVAVIMPHAFSDAPHSDSSMIYKDYYEWFIETLNLVKKIDHIEWLIKPHPSSMLYFEEGEVANIIKDVPFIKTVPPDIKATSVFELVDAVVTIRGTAGLECVLFDAQPILGGDSYYMDLGFTTNCKDVQNYELALNGIKKKTKIPDETKDKIKKIIFWRNHSYFYYSGIYGPERVPNMAEEEVLEHEMKNYDHVLNYLKHNNFKDDLYYKELLKFFKENKKELSAVEFINDKRDLSRA